MKPSSPAADHQPFFFFRCVTSTRTGTAISFCSSGAAQKLASVSCFTSSFGRSSRMAPPSLPVAPCSRPWSKMTLETGGSFAEGVATEEGGGSGPVGRLLLLLLAVPPADTDWGVLVGGVLLPL